AAASMMCGGGGGTPKLIDSNTKTPDAKVFMDAPPMMANGIGKDCTGGGSGDPSLCPTTDPICVRLSAGGKFFCTKTCGTAGSAMPPAGGDATCKMMETSTGTPA